MDPIIRRPVNKRTPLHFLVDGLQVWVSYLDENKDGPFGVMFKWMEGVHDSEPLRHITEDGGYTYQKFASYWVEAGMDARKGVLETDPEKLNRLNGIWVVYQQQLGETVFSV
jgi:hypothetical protein